MCINAAVTGVTISNRNEFSSYMCLVTSDIISERELMFMFAICRRPSFCLSSVCNVRAPYSAD